MKKVLFVMLLMGFLLMITTSAQAGGFWKGLFVKEGPVKKADPTVAPIQTILGSLPFNLNGDTFFLCSEKSFAAGASIDLASYRGIVSLAGMAAGASNSTAWAGAGPMINIPNLLNLIPGMNWNASYINPSIGGGYGCNFTKMKGEFAVGLRIINLEF